MEGIYAHADLLKVYKALLDATQEIAIYLRYHSGKWKKKEENIDFTILSQDKG